MQRSSLIARLTDRSFALTLGAILAALGAALTGEVTWAQALVTIVAAIVPFIVGEKFKDAQAVKGK